MSAELERLKGLRREKMRELVAQGRTNSEAYEACYLLNERIDEQASEDALSARVAADIEVIRPPAPEPEPSPDWHARYKGYAYRQTVKTRNTMAAELARDIERARKSPAELERQAARLASYTELIDTLDALKGMLK